LFVLAFNEPATFALSARLVTEVGKGDRQRRHNSIGMLTPIEYEKIHHTKTA
jgi:hypothetical protein